MIARDAEGPSVLSGICSGAVASKAVKGGMGGSGSDVVRLLVP